MPPRSLVAAVRDSGAPRGGAGREGSVQEALAGFFPPASRAPLVPVLDAVHLTALLGFTADFPAKGRSRKLPQTVKFRVTSPLYPGESPISAAKHHFCRITES